MAILPLSGILQRLRRKQDKLLAQQEDKTTSAEIAEPAGTQTQQTYHTPLIDDLALSHTELQLKKLEYAMKVQQKEMEIRKQQIYLQLQMSSMRRAPQPQAFERHAVLHIKGDKSSMLLDFDVQVHMSEDGEFESLIIASADTSVTILRDEFLRRLNEGDMLCGIIYKRIVAVKMMDEKDKKEILRGDFLKQGKDVFVMMDGKLVKVDQ